MIAIAGAAMICEADDWVSIARFARTKKAWLRNLLDLKDGISSHDTFGRVFSLLAPDAFEQCFRDWVNSVRTSVPGIKGNQSRLAEQVEEAFIDADARDYAGLNSQGIEASERDHGRVETRRYRIFDTVTMCLAALCGKGST